MSTPRDSGLCAGQKSMMTEIAFGGVKKIKKDVRGCAVAGELLVIDELLNVLNVCGCEELASRSAGILMVQRQVKHTLCLWNRVDQRRILK